MLRLKVIEYNKKKQLIELYTECMKLTVITVRTNIVHLYVNYFMYVCIHIIFIVRRVQSIERDRLNTHQLNVNLSTRLRSF